MGAEIIVSFGILNKASGFYGLASLLTGHPISAMEWVLNIWSLVLLTMFLIGYNAIRNKKALALLSFAHFYVVDTLFSIAFTIFFCVKWFKIQRKTKTTSVIYSARDASTAAATNLFSDSASLAQESATSIILTVFVLLARIYFAFVIIGYARQLIRRQNLRRYNGSPKGSWSATLQQVLLTPFEYFWTGFNSSNASASSPLMSGNSNSVDEDRVPLSETKYEDDEEQMLAGSSR